MCSCQKIKIIYNQKSAYFVDIIDTQFFSTSPCYTKLECGHSYHTDCILDWYKKTNDETIRLILPFPDDLPHIHFFPNNDNTVKCALCQAEYTIEL